MDVTSVGMAERLRLETEAGTKPNVRTILSEMMKFVFHVTRRWMTVLVATIV